MMHPRRFWLLVSLLLLAVRLLAQPDLVPVPENLANTTDVPKLLLLLKNSEPPRCIDIIRQLAMLNDPRAIEPLIALLHAPQAPVRTEVARALLPLSRGNNQAVTRALLPLLQDTDEEVCRQALIAFSNLAEPGIIAPATRIANDPASHLCIEALQALLKLNDPRTIPVFENALWDADTRLHYSAINGLKGIPDQRVAYILENRLHEMATDADVTELGQLIGTQLRYLNNIADNDAKQLTEALIEQQTDIFAPCQALISSRRAPARAVGIILLGWKRDLRATEPAIGLLHDTNKLVRWAAVRTLGNLGDVHALTPLTALLADDTPRIRTATAAALSAIGDRRAIEPLAARLTDAEAEVRSTVALALATLGDPRAAEPLLILCQQPDPRQRAQAVALLGNLPDPRLMTALEHALTDPYNVVCVKAIEALGTSADPRAVELLLLAMKDAQPGKPLTEERFPTDPLEVLDMRGTPIDPRVRAVMVLGQRQDPRALEPLLAAMKSLDKVRDFDQVVPPAIAKYHDPRVLPALIEDAKRGSWASLSQLYPRGAEVSKPLQQMLLDPAYPQRNNLWACIRCLPRNAYPALLDHPAMLGILHRWLADDQLRYIAVGLLEIAKDPRSVAPLLAVAQKGKACNREDWQETNDCNRAISALVAIHLAHPHEKTITDALLPVLTDLTRSTNPEVAMNAQAALAQCGQAEAIRPLLETARTATEKGLRKIALCAVARVDDPRVTEVFRTAFRDRDVQVRRDALYAALSTSKTITESLLADAQVCLWDVDAEVRGSAERYLTDAPSSIPILCSRLLDADYLQRQRLLAMVSFWRMPEAVNLLIGLLRDPQQGWPPMPSMYYGHPVSLRMEAAHSLGIIGDKRAVEPLIAALEVGDLSCRQAVVEALGALKDRRAVPTLINALEHLAGDAHAGAATALKTITGQDFGADPAQWRAWWAKQMQGDH